MRSEHPQRDREVQDEKSLKTGCCPEKVARIDCRGRDRRRRDRRDPPSGPEGAHRCAFHRSGIVRPVATQAREAQGPKAARPVGQESEEGHAQGSGRSSRQDFQSGATIVNIHAGQRDQIRVIDFYGTRVLPEFRRPV